jgi:hypothetical protein
MRFDLNSLSKKIVLTFTVGMLFASGQAISQRLGAFVPYSTVGVGVGTSNYYGDMAGYRRPVQSTFGMLRWSVGANYTRHFTPRFAARAAFTYARIAGDDFTMNSKPKYESDVRIARNLHFRNDLKEFSVVGIYKLIPDDRNFEHRKPFGAYLFGGLGLTAHNPKAKEPFSEDGKGSWVKLQPLGTEGQGLPGYDKPYSLVQLVVPMGLGLRYKINSRIDIAAELGFRFTFTDYLDDVAGNYATGLDNAAATFSNRSGEPFTARKGVDRTEALNKLLSYAPSSNAINGLAYAQELNSPGGVRGNSPTTNDTYMFGMIHINYILPSQIKCPPLR